MKVPVREKFSSQAAPELLSRIREMAASEGRQFQAVLEEALREYVERKEQGRPRRPTLEAFQKSLFDFDALYRELAK